MDFIEYYFRVAHHEAGPTVVGAALGCPVESVTISPIKPNAMVRNRKTYFDLDEVRRHLAVNFAGYLAERRAVEGRRAEALKGAVGDFATIRWWDPQRNPLRQTKVRYHFCRAEDWRAFVREQVRMTNQILRANWEAVVEIAMVLLDVETLKGRELRRMLKLVDSHLLEPSPVLEKVMSAAA